MNKHKNLFRFFKKTIGIFLLNIPFLLHAQVPVNDDPCVATEVFFSSTCNNPLTFSNLNATTSLNNGYSLPGCANTNTPKDVWFKIKTTNNGSTTDTKFAITTNGAAIGQIRIFSAISCSGPFSEIGQACEPTLNTTRCIINNAQANTIYYIMVGGYWSNSPTGNFTICATPPPIAGCTNPLATNYNVNATFDNGTCTFPDPTSTCGFFTSSPNLLITNNLITNDIINISIGANKVLTDLDVVLKLNHSFLSDLDVFLISPKGTQLELFKNICGASDNMEVRFDDDSYPLQCGNPTYGFYKLPINALSVFNNEPSDGNWTLKIVDMSAGNNGILSEWCLIPQVKTVTCFPPYALKVNDLSTTSATLDWSTPNVPVESSWNIELGSKGFSPTGIPTKIATTKPYLYTGLLPNKSYDFYVQSKCLPSLGSGWSGPYTFTTAIPNGQCNLGINIPDNQCNASNNFAVNVQNAGGTQLGNDVQLEEVRMILRHTWDSDLSVYLTSPNNKTVELTTKNGQSLDNYGDPNAPNCSKYTAFVKNDCAAVPINGAQAPFIGKFFPEGNLSDFIDGSNPNGNWTFKICDETSGDVGKIEFLELVFSSNTCAQPRNVDITNVLDKSFDLSFLSQNTSCKKIIVEYGAVGFTPGINFNPGVGGTVKIINCPATFPINIAGLQPLTNYDIYVREQCNNLSFSPNSCTATIETDCSTPALTLLENFNSQNICNTVCGDTCLITGVWKNVLTDDFDWLVNAGSTSSTDTGPDDDVSGGKKYIYIEAGTDGTCQNGKTAHLVSDCIKINANVSTCSMSFYYHAFGQNINKLGLEITTDGGANWSELWSISGNQGNRWKRQYLDLQAFNNKIVQFRFVGYGGNGIKADLAIDQIEFYGATSLGTATFSYFKDADNDGYGDFSKTILGCSPTPPTGFVINSTDCDDNNNLIKPSAAEIPCNKIDENCNGMADDPILASPLSKNDTVCIGNTATLKAIGNAFGQFYWYDSPNSNQIIGTGNSLTTNALNNNTTYYLKDSLLVKPGLRFTELNLGNIDAVELQNIGASKDYTGWSVVIGNSSLQPLTTTWDLGNFTSNEVQYRTKLPSNNYFGTTWNWTYTGKGFALLIDNQGIARDFVLFNSSQLEFESLNFIVKNKNYTKNNLPWKGAGINTAVCNNPQSISLSTNNEKNEVADYSPCATNTMGNPNLSFNLDYPCNSLRVPVQAIVQPYPSLSIPMIPEVCQGQNFDVRNIVVNDLNNTNGTLTYHSTSPATNSNQLISNILSPNNNINIVIKKTSNLGCSSEKLTSILVNDLPVTNIVSSTTMPLCSGQTKTLSATYSGGTSPVNYVWSTGAVSQNIQVGNSFPSITGFYAVTIIDSKGCKDSSSFDVFNGAGITSAKILNIKDVSSCNGNDGEISIKPIDGTPPYKYTWSGVLGVGNIGNIAGQYNIQNLSKGTYSVTISDSSPLNCELIIPFLVVKSPDVNVKIDSIWKVSCKGQKDGKIFLQNPNNQPFTYKWSNGKTTKNIDSLSAGTYAVTISSSSCSQIIQNIVVKEPDSLGLLSAISADVSCTTNGKILITPIGGNGNYQYLWSNATTQQNLTNVSIGTYNVTITDQRLCKYFSPDIVLKAAPSLALNWFSTPAICNGTATAKINLSVTGGGRPYSYLWSNGATSEDLDNIIAKDYFVSVTDANGCQVVSPVIKVTQPAAFQSNPLVTAPSCKGFSNGEISLNVIGGTPNYTYKWSTGSTQNAVNQLIEGVYKATISDANNCKIKLDSIKVIAPQVLNVKVKNIFNASCAGKPNGRIDIEINGGNTPYNFNWSSGQTSQNLPNTIAGTYQLSITDNNGCKAFLQNMVVGGNQVLSVVKDSLVKPTCNGFNDGKIFFEVKGGIFPFNYSWSNNTFNSNIFNLKSGTYTVTASDITGCAMVKKFQLAEPNPISISLNSIDSIGCYGAEDATIDVTINGGTPPFKFFWNTGQNSEDLSGIAAGAYKLTILDKFNCAGFSGEFTVPQSQPLLVNLQSNNTSKCVGTTFGNLDIKVSGGKKPYKYLWSNGSSNEDLTGVPNGTYSVTVSDANDCKATLSNIIILSPLQELRFDTIITTKITCYNYNNAQIVAVIKGGKAPFAYSWEGIGENMKSTHQDTVKSLSKGFYHLTVTDNLGCSVSSDTIEITNPAPLNALVYDVQNVVCKGGSNGYIKTKIEGGTTPYSFIWNNGVTTNNLYNIGKGNYKLTVTDVNKCTKIASMINIAEPQNSVTIKIDSIHNISCKNGTDGDIFLKTTYGEPPFTYAWSKPLTTNTGTINGLSAGVYNVTVTDFLQCFASIDFIQVPEPQAIGIFIDTVKQNLCKGFNGGSILVTGIGGVPPYKFKWSNNKTTEDIFNLSNGNYKTTITDFNNCTFISNDININSPDSLKANISTTIVTMGLNNGTASANVSGGKAPFTYKWNDPNKQTTQTATNLSAGTYDVTITDVNLCSVVKKGNIVGTTASQDLDLEAFVKIYPNPSEGFLTIEYEFVNWLENTTLVVNDIFGKNIFEKEINTSADKIEIDLNHLNCGVYFVAFKNKNKVFSVKKVVICR